MDIYKYIPSRAITDYIKEIGHEFTLPEKAAIIYHNSRTTFNEKFAAWKELIDTEPDCTQAAGVYHMELSSYHAFLREYMDLQFRKIDRFKDNSHGKYIYYVSRWHHKTFRYNADDDGWRNGQECYFTTYEACVKYIKSVLMEDDGGADFYRISRAELNSPDSKPHIYLECDENLDIIDVSFSEGMNDKDLDIEAELMGLYFIIPTPFRHGDIVKSGEEKMVLDTFDYWDSRTMLERGVPADDRRISRADRQLEGKKHHVDSSDMMAYGYAVITPKSRNYSLYKGAYYIDFDGFGIMGAREILDMEYYEPSESAEDKILKLLSMKLQRKIGEDTFANVYRFLVREGKLGCARTALCGEYDADIKSLLQRGEPK